MAIPFTLIKNPVVAGRNLDYYRYDGGDIKGTREELLACMASIKIEQVFDAVNQLLQPLIKIYKANPAALASTANSFTVSSDISGRPVPTNFIALFKMSWGTVTILQPHSSA